MVKHRFLRLSDVARVLYESSLKLPPPNLLELLQSGELEAVIKFPRPLDPYKVPKDIWESLDLRGFRIRRYQRRGPWIHYRIPIAFAVDAYLTGLKSQLENASSKAVIRRDSTTTEGQFVKAPLSNTEVIDEIIFVAAMRNRKAEVFVLSDIFERFKEDHKIKDASSAGRKRIASKDDMIVEILKRGYCVARRPKVVRKKLIAGIQDWMNTEHSEPVSGDTVRNIIAAIDLIAESQASLK